MKKVITAMGNPSLNEKLESLENIEIVQKDIFYKEGVLEFLEENNNVDIVIINESICENNILEFLQQILYYDIEIMLLLDENEHYLDEFENLESIKIFSSEEEIISNFDPSKEYSFSKVNNKLKNNKRVISFLGSNGVGKTVLSSLVSKELSKENKVLIIDFDIFGNNLNYLFNIKKVVKSYEIDDLIEKVNNNLYILSDMKYIFNENNKIEKYKVKEIFDELKKRFDFLIIDTSSETYLKYIKTILPNCDYNIFIIEANLLETKKAKTLLETFCYDFGLDLEKTEILVNKYNDECVDLEIVREVFENIKFLNKIKYNSKFNLYVNTFTKSNIKIEEIKQLINELKGGNEVGKFNRIRKYIR